MAATRRIAPLAGLYLVPALMLGLAACTTPQERVQEKEDHLAAAGFMVKPANTPERQAMLQRLPPHKFVQHVHGDQVMFVYADPLVCDCLYVGNQDAYNHYKLYRQQQQLADQQEMTAQMYSDPAWRWGAWGPWGGPYGPAFGAGFGPGFGW